LIWEIQTGKQPK